MACFKLNAMHLTINGSNICLNRCALKKIQRDRSVSKSKILISKGENDAKQKYYNKSMTSQSFGPKLNTTGFSCYI